MKHADALRLLASALLADAAARAASLEVIADALESGGDELVPLDVAAETLLIKPRVLRDAARRGELVIEGPRRSRVIRRGELDRWLRERRPQPMLRAANDTGGGDAEALARSAARLRRG